MIRIILAALALAFTVPSFAAPSGFTFCAGEGEACDLRGVDAYVTFGAGEASCNLTAGTCTGTYTPLIRTGGGADFYVVCRQELFVGPDPAPGVGKSCFWAPAGGTTSADPASSPASSSIPSPWDIPDPALLNQFFWFGLTGVVSCYLVAWACAQVLDAIKN